MEEAKTMKTPMSSSIKLDKDEKGKSINSTMYRGMIGSLLYLTASRPDIIYLKGTMDIGLWYPKGDNFELIGFSDADFAGCKVERKNTSGTCHFLGHSLVSWHSKKQNSVALSTAEAKYIAREKAASRAQGKRSTEPSQLDQTETHRNARGVENQTEPGEHLTHFRQSLQLDSGCMSPRCGLLCRVSSLERLFKGCAALQTPRGWANHRHIV
ncbi:Retrovirus-related Pol polyprotein from transposon RE1 [Vitis vinifera]|uniref:Retrovirus-related Pol polyprotein from transposon RE1 n=1 Tax=Vitis vinifera TaxID=29760 RepID=A0A438GGG3_VITVI|nr:Retrovirus-related Pol polyprotein from transposon RE1 [Vitis vinifera]